MNKKILIIGARGSLGKQIINTLKFFNYADYIGLNRKDVDVIKNFKKLEKIIKKFKPSHIINCAAMTGLLHCETEPDLAYEVNTIFPLKLANVARNLKTKLIHFSTEAVFKGNIKYKIYSEKDIPEPTSIYGKSKLLADQYLNNYKNNLIIRLPVLFGPTHEGQIVDRLIKKLLQNKKIFVATDVYSTPIYSPDLSRFIFLNGIKKNYLYTGKIIHFTSEKYLSMYQLIKNLAKLINKEKLIKGVKDSFFGNNRLRPRLMGLKPKFLGLKNIDKRYIYPLEYEKFMKYYE